MQPVYARVLCTHVDTYTGSQEVFFQATKRQDRDNADFTKYTPSGEVRFTISSEATAFNKFTPGKYYELEFVELD